MHHRIYLITLSLLLLLCSFSNLTKEQNPAPSSQNVIKTQQQTSKGELQKSNQSLSQNPQKNIRGTELLDKKLTYSVPQKYSSKIGSYQNKNVIRTINLRDRYAYQTLTINPISLYSAYFQQQYTLIVKTQDSKSLNSIELSISDRSSAGLKQCKLTDSETTVELKYFNFNIKNCIQKHSIKVEDIKITVRYVWAHKFQPLPKKIPLSELQSIYFETDRYPISLYSTQFISTSFEVVKQASKYNDFTKFQEWSETEQKVVNVPVIEQQEQTLLLKYQQSDKKIIAPLQYRNQDIFVHFVSNIPLVYFKKVEKRVQISQWGNLHVDQNYYIGHEGAELTREFTRAEYSVSKPSNGRWAFRMMSTSLPVQTWGLSVRDFIGNISTTNAMRQHNRVDLRIEPRFPIFGNQNATIFQSYNLPIQNYVNYDTDEKHHILHFSFSYSHFKKIADSYELEIILPSMTSDWEYELNLEKNYKFEEDLVEYGFLDLFFGKKKLKFIAENIGEKDNVQLVIKYKISNIYLFIKPVCLSCIIFVFYIALIFANRFDLTIRSKIPVRKSFEKRFNKYD